MAEISKQKISQRKQGVDNFLNLVNRVVIEPKREEYKNKEEYERALAKYQSDIETSGKINSFFTEFGQVPIVTTNEDNEDTPAPTDSYTAEKIKEKYIELYREYINAKYELDEQIIPELKQDLIANLKQIQAIGNFEVEALVNALPKRVGRKVEIINVNSSGKNIREVFDIENIGVLNAFFEKNGISNPNVKKLIIDSISGFYEEIKDRENENRLKLRKLKRFVDGRRQKIETNNLNMKQQEILKNDSNKDKEVHDCASLLDFEAKESFGLKALAHNIIFVLLGGHEIQHFGTNHPYFFYEDISITKDNLSLKQTLRDQYCAVTTAYRISGGELDSIINRKEDGFFGEVIHNFLARHLTKIKEDYLVKIESYRLALLKNRGSDYAQSLSDIKNFLNKSNEEISKILIQNPSSIPKIPTFLGKHYLPRDFYDVYCSELFEYLNKKDLNILRGHFNQPYQRTKEIKINSFIETLPDKFYKQDDDRLIPKSEEELNKHLSNPKNWLVEIPYYMSNYWLETVNQAKSGRNIKIPEVTNRVLRLRSKRDERMEEFQFNGCSLAEARVISEKLHQENQEKYFEIKNSGKEDLLGVLEEYYGEKVLITLVNSKIKISADHNSQITESTLNGSKLVADRNKIQTLLEKLGDDYNFLKEETSQINIFDDDLTNLENQLLKIMQKLQEKIPLFKIAGILPRLPFLSGKNSDQNPKEKLENDISNLQDEVNYLQNLQKPDANSNSDFLALRKLEPYLEIPEILTKIQSKFTQKDPKTNLPVIANPY